MRYIVQHITILVSQVLESGTCSVGPYVIIEYVEKKLLSKYFKNSVAQVDIEALNSDVSDTVLRKAYVQMAQILLQLLKCRFSEIETIAETEQET